MQEVTGSNPVFSTTDLKKMNFSYWEKNTFIKNPDVTIIGSGIVGLFTALFLKMKSPKLHVLVLERGILPYGASTRNAGFACYGSPSELLSDLKVNSEEEVFSLVEKRWKGLKKMREMLGDDTIGYEPFGGYEVFPASPDSLFEKCLSQLPYLNKHLASLTGEKEIYQTADETISTFGFQKVQHIIRNKGEGQLHTGKMMQTLHSRCRNEGVEILNGVNVDKFEDLTNGVDVVISNFSPDGKRIPGSSIHTKRLLICSNGFSKKFLPSEDIEPARAQVLITKPIENLKVKGSFHFQNGFYYFRNVENRILLGGGRNLDIEKEATEEFGLTSKIQDKLDELLKTMILPDSHYSIDMRWSGIMGLGRQKSPIIKKTGNNIYCAVRMGGMGIAIGSQVGEDAADLVLNNF